MVEAIVKIFGMCITFLPPILYFRYLLIHVNRKTEFDYHINNVKDKKGTLGVVIAYITKILQGMWITSMGVLMTEFFQSELALEVFFVSLISYIIFKYFDLKNEK